MRCARLLSETSLPLSYTPLAPFSSEPLFDRPAWEADNQSAGRDCRSSFQRYLQDADPAALEHNFGRSGGVPSHSFEKSEQKPQ